MATCADLLQVRIPDDAGEDSVSFLPALLGDSNAENRPSIVNHSSTGRFAIRQGKWKLEFCPGSGGWAAPKDETAIKENLPPVQLYDLESDAGETKNLYAEYPDIVNRLRSRLETEISNGRSTPGSKQPNDVAAVQFELPSGGQ